MSDFETRPTPFVGADPTLDLPPVLPVGEALAFPAVTSEGVTPLGVPAMSREDAARRLAAIEAASIAAPSSTPISVRLQHAKAADDAVDTTLRLALGFAVLLTLAMLAWGLASISRGIDGSMSSVAVTESD